MITSHGTDIFYQLLFLCNRKEFNKKLANRYRNRLYPPPPPPSNIGVYQVNHELICFQNHDVEEGVKWEKYEYQGGISRDSKGRLYGEEGHGGKKYKNKEGDVRLCPVITMILKYVSQNGVALPNNRDGNYPLCNFLATPFL